MTQKLKLILLALLLSCSNFDAAFCEEHLDQSSNISRSKLIDNSQNHLVANWTERDKKQVKQLWDGASKTSKVLKTIERELLQAEYSRDRIKEIFAESLSLAISQPTSDATNKKEVVEKPRKASVSEALITANNFVRLQPGEISLTDRNLEPDYPVPGGQAPAYLLPIQPSSLQQGELVGLAVNTVERPTHNLRNDCKSELRQIAQKLANSFHDYKDYVALFNKVEKSTLPSTNKRDSTVSPQSGDLRLSMARYRAELVDLVGEPLVAQLDKDILQEK